MIKMMMRCGKGDRRRDTKDDVDDSVMGNQSSTVSTVLWYIVNVDKKWTESMIKIT